MKYCYGAEWMGRFQSVPNFYIFIQCTPKKDYQSHNSINLNNIKIANMKNKMTVFFNSLSISSTKLLFYEPSVQLFSVIFVPLFKLVLFYNISGAVQCTRAVTGDKNYQKPRKIFVRFHFPDIGLVPICIIESAFYKKWR